MASSEHVILPQLSNSTEAESTRTIASATPHESTSCFFCFDMRDLELAEGAVQHVQSCLYCGMDAPHSEKRKFMQCRSCSFEFCTICGGAWLPERGCTSKICIVRRLWHAAFWGDDEFTRFATRSLAIPFLLIVLCVALAGGAAVAGLGLAGLLLAGVLAAIVFPLIAVIKCATGAAKNNKGLPVSRLDSDQ